MAASNPSIYEKFTIESADGRKTVDISSGVINFTYYENLFSPTLTAKAIVVNTSNTVKAEDGKVKSLYNGLPLRGGERVVIKIAGNSKVNKEGLDFSKSPEQYFHVSSITNVLVDSGKEILTLNLISREALTNETSRVGKKFPSTQRISDSVRDIIKKYLSTDKINEIDETQNPYGFIGNMKKPYTVITWLASKSIAYKGDGEDSTAGFLFYETSKGLNFKSIDNLIKQKPFEEDYIFNPGIIDKDDPKKDFSILQYGIDRNQDLLGKLERGAYSSMRYYINPVTFGLNPDIVFNSKKYIDKTSNLGSKQITLPKINDDSDLTLGDLPSRIFVGMLDVGTVEKDASEDGWNDPAKRNADPAKIHSQSMMRYNQLMTQVIEVTIPLNLAINAGSLIRCEFPSLENTERKEPDPDTSGLYMIKELAHYFDSNGSYSKLKLVRDSFGRK
tara:strand:- start:2607 stop:3944 length:1338 start_codon:yes stop_codon:yes gene_type:complete